MASVERDELMRLFRTHPALAPELLREPLGFTLPTWSEVRLKPPASSRRLLTGHPAECFVLLRNDRPVLAIVVEVQLSRSGRRRERWPGYLTSLRAQTCCPTVLLVVAPDEGVARWCARPIALGHPGFVLRPLVLGPAAFRMSLGRNPTGLPSELAAARKALESVMRHGGPEYQSEFARKFVAHGMERGREEGILDGERQALVKVLEARGFTVEGVVHRRILACSERAQLERWLAQAVAVKSVQELFQPQPIPQRAKR